MSAYDDLPKAEFAFPGPIRDMLVTAVLSGAKSTTTSLYEDYARSGDPLPAVGRRSAVIDSDGRPVAVVETTQVRVLPLAGVDLAHAVDEGEGYETVAHWRTTHERFWNGDAIRHALGEPRPAITDDTLVVAERFRLVSPSTDELLDIVDEHDRVVGQAQRGEATARGLRHRCVFILVRDGGGLVFVHRRTPVKLVFPSLYDMFVGGVVGAGEAYDDAALREAEEELGVTGLPRPVPLFSFLYEGSGEAAGHTWWSRVYEVRCELPVSPQAEEVAWHTFLTDEQLEARLPEWEWVPDGLEAFRRLRERQE